MIRHAICAALTLAAAAYQSTPPAAANGALESMQVAPNTLTAAEKSVGWRLLFDGTLMKGWHGLGFANVPAGLWVVEDGAIKHLTGGKGPGQPLTGMDLISDEKFIRFELSWEWKIAETGNSGLKYNVDEALSTAMAPPHAAKGWEYQMLDDLKAEDNTLGTHRSGALYEMFPAPDTRKLNAVGQWNRWAILPTPCRLAISKRSSDCLSSRDRPYYSRWRPRCF